MANAPSAPLRFLRIERYLALPIFFPWALLYLYCLRHSGEPLVKKMPNAISYFRGIGTLPNLVLLHLTISNPSWAIFLVEAWCFGFLAYSDRIDGMIARNCDAISESGKMVDAGMDKPFYLVHMAMSLWVFMSVWTGFFFWLNVGTFAVLFLAEIVLVSLAIQGWRLKSRGYKVVLGSNNFGKFKFNLEILTFALAAIFAVLHKASIFEKEAVSPIVTEAGLLLSLAFASLSIKAHLAENQSAVKPVVVLETTGVMDDDVREQA